MDNPCHYPINYYNLPYDCGLSYARNFLVQKAYEARIKYCFLTADSIKFTEKYNLEPIINFLNSNEKNALVGFDLKDRQSFEYDLELNQQMGRFVLKRPKREVIVYQNIQFQPVDICRNFFLAKTEKLIEVKWDNILKLCEHEDRAYRAKNEGQLSYYTNVIQAEYIPDKPPEYAKMRSRLYTEFVAKLKQKYNLTTPGGWIHYDRT